jgi:5'-nucleotidase/UDP-sugar diphosphatase
MKNKKIAKIVFLFLILSIPTVSNSKLIQILHTNDTHSYLDSTTHDPSKGGSSRLKSLIDHYKSSMKDQGVNTIVMDAGDFTEGNLYYMADRGRRTFQVQNEMGYDVVALGNHDYLMGSKELDSILGEMDLNFSFLAANVSMSPNYENIKSKIEPYKELEIDGIKIAVLGLTTNELFYKWRLAGGVIMNPYRVAAQYEEILKNRNNDFIIALTHIGVLNDIKLAEKTKNIDLIVGGHSHTALFEPSFGINKNNKSVPIVQAGMHTEYLGRILVDLEKGRPLKIVKYELVPVKSNDGDGNMDSIIEQANNKLDLAYGKEWLDEVVGYSDLKADDENGDRKWAYFITDTIREKASADVAIHTPAMNGEDFPVGNVTRRDLFNSIPRVFELNEKMGWNIYTTKIRGIWLKLVFEALSYFGQPLTFSGMKMDFTPTEHGLRIGRITINGKSVNPFKFYTVAFTEGIVRGAEGISPYTLKILRTPTNTKQKIWLSLEEKLAHSMTKMNLTNLSEDDHSIFMPNKNASLPE